MTLQFGISSSMHPNRITPKEEFFGFVRKAEELNYDSLWIGDHIAFHSHHPESLTMMGAFAAITRRITIGTCVYLLPLRRPAVAAKAAATVDYLSGGRFIFGVGVGGEGKKEFEVCGVPLRERGRRTDESIEILRKLWTGEEASHRGRFWRFEGVRQSPPPHTPGGPPIWVGGRSDAARRRAATLGDGYVSYMFTAKRFAEGLRRMREWAAEAGRALAIEEGKWTPAHHAFIYCHKDEKRALERGIENLSTRYSMDFRGIAEKYLFYGPVGRCLEQVEAFKEAGVTHFIFKHAGPESEEIDQMALLAEELIPRARA